MNKFAKLRLCLIDCVSFAIMKELGCAGALTFDDDFTKAGFVRIPGRRR